MTDLLEAIMLLCFGCSWPINLIKNIKASSAKSMSLLFIILIIVGYVAGISAKIMNQKFNYVFAVYIFNLTVVAMDLVVYFINKRKDMKLSSKTEIKA